MTALPHDLAELSGRAQEMAGYLRALSHPTRLLILCVLTDGERSVGAIDRTLGGGQPNISRELARLRDAGLVTARRQAKEVYYSLSGTIARGLIQALCAQPPDANHAVSEQPRPVPQSGSLFARTGRAAHPSGD